MLTYSVTFLYLNSSNTTSYIRLMTAEGLLVSDLLLETFVLLFVLPCISYASIAVMAGSCSDLNFWCSRISDLAFSNNDERMSSSIGSIIITKIELLGIWKKRNSWKWLFQMMAIILFVCCTFYVTYGRTPGRYNLLYARVRYKRNTYYEIFTITSQHDTH